jgi:hypothetical protein
MCPKYEHVQAQCRGLHTHKGHNTPTTNTTPLRPLLPIQAFKQGWVVRGQRKAKQGSWLLGSSLDFGRLGGPGATRPDTGDTAQTTSGYDSESGSQGREARDLRQVGLVYQRAFTVHQDAYQLHMMVTSICSLTSAFPGQAASGVLSPGVTCATLNPIRGHHTDAIVSLKTPHDIGHHLLLMHAVCEPENGTFMMVAASQVEQAKRGRVLRVIKYIFAKALTEVSRHVFVGGKGHGSCAEAPVGPRSRPGYLRHRDRNKVTRSAWASYGSGSSSRSWNTAGSFTPTGG